MAEQLRFKVYIGAIGDFLRNRDGTIRLYTVLAEAEADARANHGFVLPADAPSPGGFDRTWA